MSIYCGTTCVSQPYYDSTKLSKVIYNGTTVWPDKAILLTSNVNNSGWAEWSNCGCTAYFKNIQAYDTADWVYVVNPYKDAENKVHGGWPDGGSYNMCMAVCVPHHAITLTCTASSIKACDIEGQWCSDCYGMSNNIPVPAGVTLFYRCWRYEVPDEETGGSSYYWTCNIYGIAATGTNTYDSDIVVGVPQYYAIGTCGTAVIAVNCTCSSDYGLIKFSDRAFHRDYFKNDWDGDCVRSNICDSCSSWGIAAACIKPTIIACRYCLVYCRDSDDYYYPDHFERTADAPTTLGIAELMCYNNKGAKIDLNFDPVFRLENECWASCWYDVTMFGRGGGEGGTACYCNVIRGRWWTMYPK